MSRFYLIEFVPQENPEHFEQMLPAFLEIWNDPANLKFLSFTQKPFEEYMARYWLGQHLDANVHYFGTVDETVRIVGLAVVKSNPIEGFELFGLGVRSEDKRQGAGLQLVTRVEEMAAVQGFRAVNAQVFADNKAMLCLLLKQGYLPVRMEYHRRDDGADIVYMKKRL